MEKEKGNKNIFSCISWEIGGTKERGKILNVWSLYIGTFRISEKNDNVLLSQRSVVKLKSKTLELARWFFT